MKKRVFIRLTSFALCLIMIIAGCSVKRSDVAETYSPENNLNITIWNTQGTEYQRKSTIENNVVSDWLEEKTKVSIKSIYGNDGGQWDIKLSRLIAGDNLPDVIYCQTGQGASHFAKLVQENKLHGITDEMLTKYLPNVKKRVSSELLDKFRINGVLYGIPVECNSNSVNQPNMTEEMLEKVNKYYVVTPSDENIFGVWVRDDILQMIYPETKSWEDICNILKETGEPVGDELCDVPIYTTQDYVNFLYKIRDLGLTTENGEPVYAFGYSGTDNWDGLTYLGGDMVGYASHFYTGSWDVENECVRVPLVEDAVREAAKIQNQMVNDRVIDPESIINSSSAFREKIINGQYALCAFMYVGNWYETNEEIRKKGYDFRYRPMYVNIPNRPDYQAYYDGTFDGSSIAFTTALSEEEFIQMLNYVNVQFSDEFEEVYWWGTKEDGLYEEDEDGKRFYKDDRLNKAFVEGNALSLDKRSTNGVGVGMDIGQIYFTAVKMQQSRWNPQLVSDTAVFNEYNSLSFDFKKDSIHVTELKEGFPANPWDGTYAEIPETVKFWAEREQWENPFRFAMAVPVEEFDEAWDAAIENLNRIVNVEEMCRKMTETAKTAIAEKNAVK